MTVTVFCTMLDSIIYSVSAQNIYLRAKVATEELFLGANLSRKGANKLKATEGKMYQNAPGYPGK